MRRAKYLIGLFSLTTVLFAADPLVGTWKLNPAKSSGPGLPKEGTLVTEENGENMHSAIKATSAGGTAVSYSFDLPKAGGEGKLSGHPTYDGIAVKVLNDSTREITYTKAGKAARTTRTVIAKDGKSITVTVTGADIQGNPISGSLIEIFEKQ